MARNRTIYANEVLMVSPTATGYQFLNGDGVGESLLRQVKRIQNINYGYSIGRTDTYQFGNLARISSVVLQSPTVSLDFSYYLTDGQNENLLGFNVNDDQNFLKPQLTSDQDGRNFYIYNTEEGKDAIGSISQINAQADTKKSVVSLGNCYVTNYSANAAVGSIPMANLSVEGFNIRSEMGQGMTGRSPGIDITNGVSADSQGRTFEVDPQYISTGEGVAELLPGDIDISLGSASLLSLLTDAGDVTAAHIQNFSIDVPMSRSTLQRVGNSFGYSKVLDLPITASVSISAVLADRPTTAKSLFTELYENNKNDLTITLKKPSSLGAKQGDKSMVFKVKNAVLEGESYGMSLGDNRTVDFSFSATIGEISTDSASSYVDVNASGVYEQLQVFTTGLSTDTVGEHGMAGYGNAVAASDDYLVIGASGFGAQGALGKKGAAYIYKNNKGIYTQIMQTSGHDALGVGGVALTSVTNNGLLGSKTDPHTDDLFGGAVSINQENVLAIGMTKANTGEGIVAIMEPNKSNTAFEVNSIVSGGWTPGDTRNMFGASVAMDRDHATVSGDSKQFFAIGAPGATSGTSDDVGCVSVGFVTKGTINSATVFALPHDATAVAGRYSVNAGANIGASVGIHQQTIVAGAPGSGVLETATHSGAAWVWQRIGDSATPVAADYAVTAILSGEKEKARHPAFGTDVDVHKNIIVVGAPSGDHGATEDAGSVYVFTGRESYVDGETSWAYSTELRAGDAFGDDFFGTTVSIPNENTIIVGAPGQEASEPTLVNQAGCYYVFTGRVDVDNGISDWVQTHKLIHTGSKANDEAGKPEAALATTQKEIFAGEFNTTDTAASMPEKVIRYRI